MFSKPAIQDLFRRYVLVRLYTDRVPPAYQSESNADENRQLLQEKFGTAQSPFYVLLRPTSDGQFEIVNHYDEGKINNVEGFARFLKEPLAARDQGN